MTNCFSNLLPREKVFGLVRSWLNEDIPSFDYGSFVVGDKRREAQLLIKSPGAIAGIPFFNAIFDELGCSVKWTSDINEGDYFDCKTPLRLATVEGPCKNLLQGERIALNCLCRASGIATLTKTYIDLAQKQGWCGKVAATRKTTPGFRLVEKYAALVAGADTHRFNLSSMVMLKDNHIWSHGNITNAVKEVKSVSGFSVKVEVECRTLEEGLEAAEAGAEVIMFDNFLPEELHKAAQSLKNSHPHVIVEASGGVNEDNFCSFCGPHIDIISTSRLTQGYPAVDFSLKILHD